MRKVVILNLNHNSALATDVLDFFKSINLPVSNRCEFQTRLDCDQLQCHVSKYSSKHLSVILFEYCKNSLALFFRAHSLLENGRNHVTVKIGDCVKTN